MHARLSVKIAQKERIISSALEDSCILRRAFQIGMDRTRSHRARVNLGQRYIIQWGRGVSGRGRLILPELLGINTSEVASTYAPFLDSLGERGSTAADDIRKSVSILVVIRGASKAGWAYLLRRRGSSQPARGA